MDRLGLQTRHTQIFRQPSLNGQAIGRVGAQSHTTAAHFAGDTFLSRSTDQGRVLRAISNENAGELKAVLKDTPGISLDFRTPQGSTPLILAICKGDDDLLKVLLAHTRKPDLEYTDNRNRTPLMVAAAFGRVNMIDRLLEAGAKINNQIERSDLKPQVSTPDPIAISNRWKRWVQQTRTILGRPVPNPMGNFAPEANPANQLSGKVMPDNQNSVKRGRKMGANQSEKPKGPTALMSAISAYKPKAVEKLLKLGADPNLKCAGGYTALHLALLNHQTKLVPLLLDYGADPTIKMPVNGNAWQTARKFKVDSQTVALLKSAVQEANKAKSEASKKAGE